MSGSNGFRDSGQEGGLLCGEPLTSKGHPSPSGSPFGFLLPQRAGKKNAQAVDSK